MFSKVFGTRSQREVKRIMPHVITSYIYFVNTISCFIRREQMYFI